MNFSPVKVVLATASFSSLIACNWVKPDDGAENIALVKPVHVQNCKKLGVASATVKHKIAGLERKSKKVNDELLTLATNEALQMQGNTIVSIGKAEEGKQSFEVYLCE